MLPRGTILRNRYRILHQLGRGGMGTVYKAEDMSAASNPDAPPFIAIKERRTEADSEQLRRAFTREAQLLRYLSHPALPRVTDDFFEKDGQFLVMEYVEGGNLTELLETHRRAFRGEQGLPSWRVLSWADELLDALEYLHGQSEPVYHRDIKPDNVRMTPGGNIYLLDFGLARGKLVGQNTTTVYGFSEPYSPREQMIGSDTDARSDLYSLGATLYHLLAGEPPVSAGHRDAKIDRGEDDPLRPPHHLNPTVPEVLSEVIIRAMALRWRDRIPSAAEMRRALRKARHEIDAAELNKEIARLQRERDEAERLSRQAEEAKRRADEATRQAEEARRWAEVRLQEQLRDDRANQTEGGPVAGAGQSSTAGGDSDEAQANGDGAEPAVTPLNSFPPISSHSLLGLDDDAPPASAAWIAQDQKRRTFVGDKYDYYARKWQEADAKGGSTSFNWASFLGGMFWMAYRKMYLNASLLLAGITALGLIESAVLAGTSRGQTGSTGNCLYMGIWVAIAMHANSMYRNFMEKKLRRIEAMGLPPDQENDLIRSEGGTSVAGLLAFAMLWLATTVIEVYLFF